MRFYELQQKTGGNWKTVGYFLNKTNAEQEEEEFNTLTSVRPTRVIEREFSDFGDWDSIKDFIR